MAKQSASQATEVLKQNKRRETGVAVAVADEFGACFGVITLLGCWTFFSWVVEG